MSETQVPAIRPSRESAFDEVPRSLGTFVASPGDSTAVPAHISSAEEARLAILDELYDERNAYLTKQRLGKITSDEQLYLRDVLREIDRHEEVEGSLEGGQLWADIDALALRILGEHQSR
jgi:hypothetical protein